MKSLHFKFADLHCHPNLKTFGQSFSGESNNPKNKANVWYVKPPNWFTKAFNALTGMTKFSQADFTTLSKANVRIAFVSLYPFEKGFFINGFLNGPVSARLANMITSIGYKRIRYLQKHSNYFQDLKNEYTFLLNSCKEQEIDGIVQKWSFAASWLAVEKIIETENTIAVINTIEGAHVFNSGLKPYGHATDEEEVLHNIRLIKKWEFPPLFITLAHNFNNDLCGHARSLDQLGPLVNQFENLNKGFSELGLKVVRALLNNEDKAVFIDIKHMSLTSRLEYFSLVENEYDNKIPIIVSHGAVTGTNLSGEQKGSLDSSLFSGDDINFFDEEIVGISRTQGLFALQMDANRLANRKISKKSIFNLDSKEAISHSATIIWRQIQHIAEVLDKEKLYAWNTACIGSDFDGTINPLNGVWTAEYLPLLTQALLSEAQLYCETNHTLKVDKNKQIDPEEIIDRFIYANTINFLKKYY
jgi:hypothetical protein